MVGAFFNEVTDGLLLRLKLTPKAKKTAINAIMEEADGTVVLKLSVTAAPEKGKANAALIKFLSKEWKLAKSDMELTAGELSRHKTLLLKGEPSVLKQRLLDWMKQNNV
ncbi:DUF167 domain-containing protein [Terasakiella sp.]|uniref:DUF167 domain-containing protein n=1 Tax=Terasakiella sp. TaxID=2034861 RepID=UPI003AA8077A